MISHVTITISSATIMKVSLLQVYLFFCCFCYIFLSGLACCILCDEFLIRAFGFHMSFLFLGLDLCVCISHPPLSSSCISRPCLHAMLRYVGSCQWHAHLNSRSVICNTIIVTNLINLDHRDAIYQQACCDLSFTSLTYTPRVFISKLEFNLWKTEFKVYDSAVI